MLVYVLSAEGYTGRGIDLRRRKTWDALSVKAVLEERAVFPDRVRFGRGPAFAAATDGAAVEGRGASGGAADDVPSAPADPLWDTVAWQDEPEVEWMIGNHWYGNFAGVMPLLSFVFLLSCLRVSCLLVCLSVGFCLLAC